MVNHAPISLGNGKFCYTGPDCKIHGGKVDGFRTVEDVFTKVDLEFPTVTVKSETTNKRFENEAKTFF